MKFLLDTDICIYLIKEKPKSVLEHFLAWEVGDIGISSITLAELNYGVEKSQQPQKNELALQKFAAPLEVAYFDDKAAKCYGIVRNTLAKQGTPIGPMDILIAAHALSLNITLVTNNHREFTRIPSLNVENWVTL